MATIFGNIMLFVLFPISHSWSYKTVSLWADFHTRHSPGWILSDYQSEFLATNYEYISIEKCVGKDRSTEDAFIEIASQIKKHNTDTKVLFYWNAFKCYCTCYDATQSFYNNQSMWLYTDAGDPIYMNNNPAWPFYDMTQSYVRDWWVTALVSIISKILEQGVMVDGVFIDALYAAVLGVSRARHQVFNDGILLLLLQLKEALNNLKPGLFILGNGLHYNCFPYQAYNRCANVAQMIDGLCYERFGAANELDNDNKYPNTYWKVESIVRGINVTQTFIEKDIAVFVKTWPQSSSNLITPATSNAEKRLAAIDMLPYPLAIFLCGMYDKNVYFSYAWSWSLNDGYVPCPYDNTTCNAPTDWYPEFMNELGRPTSPGGVLYDGYKCNRTFEYAIVYVDLADEASAEIIWLTRNPTYHPTSQTTAPTDSPTILPTTEPTVDVGYGRNRSEERKSGSGLLVIQVVVLILIVSGCVVYFCYKRTKMKINVENVNSLLIVK
eukprot:62462_1